ncbi:MAG: sulfotransferase family protein [Leptolyngbya sp. SIO1D8]|nr:sulfotransferase family protein [Leptolyngbya sp. SIO1D8]
MIINQLNFRGTMHSFLKRITKFSNKSQHKWGKSDLDGRLIILPELEAIYIPIPKVACSSLKKAFAEALDIDLSLVKSKDKSIHQIYFPYIFADEISGYSQYFKFAFVRNPWDRLVSCYKDKIKSDRDYVGRRNLFVEGVHRGLVQYGVFRAGMPFDEFVQAISEIPDSESDPHFRAQYTFLVDENGSMLVDFIGRFEQLSNDFAELCKELEISSLSLPHTNKTNKSGQKAYVKYYTTPLRELVRERYSKDIETLGYDFH